MIKKSAIAAECVGSAILVMTVVGSGIMAQQLSGGNAAVALLGNTLATVLMLLILIEILGPISGAHFNPAVTGLAALQGSFSPAKAISYVGAQFTGGLLGIFIVHAMFDQPLLQISTNLREGAGQGVSEFVATLGLLAVIHLGSRYAKAPVSTLVAAFIGAAYWFTASTSFANPMVTIARAFSDSFAGIAPKSVPLFLGAQMAAVLATFVVSKAFSFTKD